MPGSDRTVAVISRDYPPPFEKAAASIVDYLVKNYGIRQVFTEGDFPVLDVDITNIEDPDLHRKSSDILILARFLFRHRCKETIRH